MLNSLLASVRIAAATIAICVATYATAIWAFAQTVTPFTANGSLLKNETGQVIGSRLIAQPFTQSGYFWPRPSAVDYNAAGAGGSNKSPTSVDLTERAQAIAAAFGATAENPLPADLVAASGAGLDPHISLAGAIYQVPRVAESRGIAVEDVEEVVFRLAFSPGGMMSNSKIVNVLEVNLALDAN